MVSSTEKLITTIQILPNISRSKDNQTMAFDKLIEFNLRNVFLEKSYAKCGLETCLEPFLKNKKWGYLWISSLKFNTNSFHCMFKWGIPQHAEAKVTSWFYF